MRGAADRTTFDPRTKKYFKIRLEKASWHALSILESTETVSRKACDPGPEHQAIEAGKKKCANKNYLSKIFFRYSYSGLAAIKQIFIYVTFFLLAAFKKFVINSSRVLFVTG